ncbi:MAG: PilZ domain-containing protein [Terriglobales bacterium]
MSSLETHSPAVIPNPDRRRHPRYNVHVQIEVQKEGSNAPMRLETTNLSRGGCYIQPASTLPVGIRVQTTLWLDGAAPIVMHGRVISRHPQFGNGIVFVDFEGQAEPLLNQYLDTMPV